MTHKAFAFVAACSLLATLTMSATGAQTPTQPLSASTCSSGDLNSIIAVYNFDSPTYKRSESLPQGVKSYLATLLTGRLNTCVALAGPTIAKSACKTSVGEDDPRALWQQLKFCEGVLGLPPPTREQPLIAAAQPTLYVLLSIGAGSGGPPGGTSQAKSSGSQSSTGGGGGKGGSGPASGSTATGSLVDNPAYFLLFILAQRLQNDVCLRSHISPQACGSQHPVAVVPETTWNLEDFRAQCVDDPYVPNDANNPYGTGLSKPAGRGTLGAIVLNGSTVAVDGTFAIFTIYGSSEANFTGQVVDCHPGAGPPLTAVWSDNISGSNKTTAISFFPLALAGTLLAANSAAHEVAAPAPNPSSSPNALSSFITYQNDVALGTFAANTSTLTLGNPSSGQTYRHSFESWSDKFETGLNDFCKLESSQAMCTALKLPE
jgi:hypothetical protein